MVSRVAIIKLALQRSERSDPHHTVNRALERTGSPFGLSIRWTSSVRQGFVCHDANCPESLVFSNLLVTFPAGGAEVIL